MSREDLDRELDRAVRLVVGAKYLIALSGAGISVESGIPPFRGPGGIWTKYGDPDMRGYDRFLENPGGWWRARLTGEGVLPEMRSFEGAKPNPGHYALAELEGMGLLKYLLTQNVDNLHREAGNKKVAEIHGNRYRLQCIQSPCWCITKPPRGGLPWRTSPRRFPTLLGTEECLRVVPSRARPQWSSPRRVRKSFAHWEDLFRVVTGGRITAAIRWRGRAGN